MNIVFAGTPEFAVASLKALTDNDYHHHNIVAVYTQPDRPAGRGRKLQPSPVKQFALTHDLPVFQPSTLKDDIEQQRLKELAPDVMIVVAYGLLLPQAVLDIPRLGCLNVHASLLPRWRGAAPIQRSIEAGDQETGVTIMQMDAGLDTGAMLARKSTPILDSDTATDLHDRLALLGAETLIDVLNRLEKGEIKPEPQDDALANYANKLNKQEADVAWHEDALSIDRKIRAFTPWPGANTRWHNKRLRILRAAPMTRATTEIPGTIVSLGPEGIVVATGDQCLVIDRLQLEGGRAQDAAEFLNGHALAAGDRFDQ